MYLITYKKSLSSKESERTCLTLHDLEKTLKGLKLVISVRNLNLTKEEQTLGKSA